MPEKDHNVVGMEVRQLWERGYEQLEKKQWDYAMELLCMALEKEPAFFAVSYTHLTLTTTR